MTRLTDRQQSTVQELVQRVLKLEKWRRDVTGDSPLFDIANEHTPATLSTDQNDYDPGYYDVLRISATADVSITGITKGKKGRFLEFYNTSQYNIKLPHESASSSPSNRIRNSSGEEIRLFPTGRVRLYYDSTLSRWIIPDPPSWTGPYGISTRVSTATGTQTIPTGFGATHKILIDTIDPIIGDPWGLFDAANNRISIPAGMSGTFFCCLNCFWDDHPVAGTGRSISILHSFGTIYRDVASNVVNEFMGQTLGPPVLCAGGDTIEFYAGQSSGGDLALLSIQVDIIKSSR